MSKEKFHTLCQQTCFALNISDTKALEDEGKIIIDDTEISIFYDEEDAPDYLLCSVDVGEINQEYRADILESLLALNLFSGTKTSGVYAVDIFSQRAVFIVMLSLTEILNGEDLVKTLKTYTQRSKHLNNTLLSKGSLIPDLQDTIINGNEGKSTSSFFDHFA